MPLKFTIGADPEFFLWDSESKTYVSAHDKVPGNKKEPFKLPDGSAVQADGTAVEFNIEPATTSKEFREKIESALFEVRKIVPDRFEFKFNPIISYPKKIFDRIPAEAKELGCDPDYCAMLTEVKQNSVPSNIGNRRTGSGHIHIGWTSGQDTREGVTGHWDDCVTMINNLDAMYSGGLKQIFDLDYANREQFYGAPLAFRAKSYGVEYRTPSNIWLRDLDLAEWLAECFLRVAHKTAEGIPQPKYYFLFGDAHRLQNNQWLRSVGLPEIPRTFTAKRMI
jgi:hypothetical protein